MDKQNIRIDLMYDGTAYHGFQRQKNAVTIQECLETAINKITGEAVTVTGCGRTDAGVHAKGYVANFFSDTKIPMARLPLAINAYLNNDIRVKSAKYVPSDFHARFSAKKKTYSYKIINKPVSDVFLRKFAWFYPVKLDYEKMQSGAKFVLGKHDFSAFMAEGSPVKSTVRTVFELNLYNEDDIITIDITADGFLYNMVRIIVGTLVYCGNGKIEPGNVPRIISSKNRVLAGVTAPPEGLMLKEVFY